MSEKIDCATPVEIIRRLAEIESELESRELRALLDEKNTLRDLLKRLMLELGADSTYDELSNWEAVLVSRLTDVWSADALKALLTSPQRKRYLVESVNVQAVTDGLKLGDLSRARLERAGAVRREPQSVALYVRERKEQHDEEKDL